MKSETNSHGPKPETRCFKPAPGNTTTGKIENVKAYIKGSVLDMQSLLVDVENNVPKEERFFKKVENERIRGRCNFRRVCD